MLSKRQCTANITHIGYRQNGKVKYYKLDAKGKLAHSLPSASMGRFCPTMARPTAAPNKDTSATVQDFFPPVAVPSPPSSPVDATMPAVFSLAPLPEVMFAAEAPENCFEFERPSLFDGWAAAGPADNEGARLWDPFNWTELDLPTWN
jgi:hypothetical protein